MSNHNMVFSSSKRAGNVVDIKLGQLIRKLRIMRGYSQDAIAKKIGITFQQLQKYEKGINRVCVSRLVDICKFFSIRPSYFFDTLSQESDNNVLNEDEGDNFFHNNSLGGDDYSKEILTLIRAYKNISNPNVRKNVINIIKSLGDEEEN